MALQERATFELLREARRSTLTLGGHWTIEAVLPANAELLAPLEAGLEELGFDCAALADWDSVLVSMLLTLREHCAQTGVRFDAGGLPEGVRRLMALSLAVPAVESRLVNGTAWWRRLLSMRWLQALGERSAEPLAFLGELVLALLRLMRGRARTRFVDFMYFVGQAGPAAIGIISLTSVLVGMILAYLGVVQLQQFGAQIFVADLVGIGMVREMGALMSAIIMAGRTGAAYAAQLGTMQTREEIDAVNTLGISPIEFLVLPRMLALVLVMPMLCIYSDALGILGGAIVAMGMDVSFTMYMNEMQAVMTMTHIATGVIKSVAFGILIGFAGCLAGMRCGRSSEAVGQAATTAVVTALVYLIVADAAFNILYQRLGI